MYVYAQPRKPNQKSRNNSTIRMGFTGDIQSKTCITQEFEYETFMNIIQFINVLFCNVFFLQLAQNTTMYFMFYMFATTGHLIIKSQKNLLCIIFVIKIAPTNINTE